MENNLYQILLIPEIALTILTCSCLLFGLYSKKNSYIKTINAVIFSLLITILLIFFNIDVKFAHYDELFSNNSLIQFFKIIIIIGSLLSLIISKNYFIELKIDKFEVPILLMFSTIGMLILVSSNNLMLMYLAIELQSLPLYVLAALKRDSLVSAESGVKYFILGALSSGILLYGCSLIYGFTGTTSFEGIYLSLNQLDNLNLGIIFGLVFILVGLAFKVSAVPFHMWTPDVYEGSPTSITAFFAIVPKIAAVVLIYRFCLEPFGNFYREWSQIIIFLSISSMFVGAIAAIAQNSLKRLLAYSSIGHIGYVLIALAAGNQESIKAVAIYMFAYMIMNVAIFAIILSLKSSKGFVENINELSGLSKSNPIIGLSITAIMLSMAGIPPFIGFFSKFYIFVAALNKGLIVLSILGVLASVISAYYYLRIIKVIYFEDLNENQNFSFSISTQSKLILIIMLFIMSFFVFYPSIIVNVASNLKIN